MHEIKKILAQIKDIASLEGKKTVFMIANTAKIEDLDYYLIPVRNYDQVVVSGVVVFGEDVARKIPKIVDGLVDYILVDAEKKIPDARSEFGVMANIERSVKELVKKSVLISYKANDLTVDAADAFISEYFSNQVNSVGGKKIAIIGAGNIGSNLAIKLVERGAEVRLFRRSPDKLKLTVDYINETKPSYTFSKAYVSNSISEACNGVDVVIGATNGLAAIDSEVVNYISKNTLLIDIGKGSISQEAINKLEVSGIDMYRLSVESALEGLITSLISTHNTFVKKTGRKCYHGINIVSGGLIAKKGEIVVDNFSNPKYVYGIGNGYGDFNRIPDQKSSDLIKKLEILIISHDKEKVIY